MFYPPHALRVGRRMCCARDAMRRRGRFLDDAMDAAAVGGARDESDGRGTRTNFAVRAMQMEMVTAKKVVMPAAASSARTWSMVSCGKSAVTIARMELAHETAIAHEAPV